MITLPLPVLLAFVGLGVVVGGILGFCILRLIEYAVTAQESD